MKKLCVIFVVILMTMSASAGVIQSALLHPVFDQLYTCMEHWDGQFNEMGDALGTDCVIGKLTEENGRSWFRTHQSDGHKNEDWYGWQQNVLAPVDGIVVKVNENPVVNLPGVLGKGIASYLILKAQDGTMVMVAHTDAAVVKVGASVKAGQVIARVGNNGQSRHPHIHIGAWRGKEPLQVRFDQAKMRDGPTPKK